MIVYISDETTPMLIALKTVSRDVAFEHMSKIGNAVRKNAGNRMRSAGNRHHWLQTSKNGKLVPYKSKIKTKELGLRTNKNGRVDSPDSMSNMISSFMMEKSGTLIVGGRNKAFTPILRKDGQVVGVGKRQPAITKHAQSIINKLDTGKRNQYHGWGASGKQDSMESFKNARFKGRGFMMAGFRNSKGYMRQELTVGYEKTIGRAVNRVSINLKPSKKVVS